jgi:hypothetical protein
MSNVQATVFLRLQENIYLFKTNCRWENRTWKINNLEGENMQRVILSLEYIIQKPGLPVSVLVTRLLILLGKKKYIMK